MDGIQQREITSPIFGIPKLCAATRSAKKIARKVPKKGVEYVHFGKESSHLYATILLSVTARTPGPHGQKTLLAVWCSRGSALPNLAAATTENGLITEQRWTVILNYKHKIE
jgi:hypothetical protein